MRNAFDHRLVPAGLCVLVVLLIAAGGLQLVGNRPINPVFGYILSNASAYAVTGPVNEVWAQGPSHLTRLFSQGASREAKKRSQDITKFLAGRCMTLADFAEIKDLGIDGKRGAAFSMLDFAPTRSVLAIPLADPQRFFALLTRLSVSQRLTLSAPTMEEKATPDVPPNTSRTSDGGDRIAKRVQQIRIDASELNGVIVCPTGGGKPTELKVGSLPQPVESESNSLNFNVARSGEGTATIKVRCSFVFTDGTTGDCRCQIADRDCSEHSQDVQPKLMAAFKKGEWVQLNGGINVRRVKDTAFLVQAPTTELNNLGKAAARTSENLAFFHGDDTLRADLFQLAQTHESGDGTVLGAVMMPFLPFGGRLHFSLAFGAERLKGRVVVPWQTLQSKLLELIVAPVLDDPAEERALSANAELRINDPQLGYYLRFADTQS